MTDALDKLTARDEWGPWIEHDGKGCPCKGMWVLAKDDGLWDDGLWEGVAGLEGGHSWDWSNSHSFTRVIRYRIRKPSALLDLIAMVENLPAPTPERVPA